MQRRCPGWIVGATLVVATLGCGDEPSADEPAVESPDPSPTDPEASPAPPAPAAVPAAPTEPPPSGHAVAKVGALMFASSTGQVGFELPPMGTGYLAAAGLTVNVVGRKDERLAVETLVAQPAEHHCAGTLDGLADFRLRLYLDPADLVPVVTSKVARDFDDGTRVVLHPGVPVPADADPDRFLLNGTEVRVAVPSDALGQYYEPGEALSAKGALGVIHALEGHPLTYGGGLALADGELFRDGLGVAHFGITAKADNALIMVRNTCMEVTALVSNERVRAPSALVRGFDPEMTAKSAGILGMMAAEGSGYLASPYGAAFAVGGEEVAEGFLAPEGGLLGLAGAMAQTEYEVKPGTAIAWPDGSPAGQVTRMHRFDQAPRDQGGHSCFDVMLRRDRDASVVLCFSPRDVAEIEPPPPPTGWGTIGGLPPRGTGLGPTGAGPAMGGGLGTRGSFGGRGKAVPRVRMAKPSVKGKLDKDIIRRIVRAHINEVRYCYNQGLARDPDLDGRVAVQFTIGPTGKVPVAVVSKSTIADKRVGECIAKAVKRWKFPKPPGGGNAVVTYPFRLTPG